MGCRTILVIAFSLFSLSSAWGAATINLTATPATVSAGQKTVVSWTTSGASKVYFNGVGYVTLNGSKTFYPTKTTTYSVKAYGSTGWVNKSVTVTVGSVAKPVVSFSASPQSITLGGSSTLSWTVQNATTISIDQGVGTVSASGSQAVSPTATTTYTLTAQNAAGTTTASSKVTVTAPTPTLSVTIVPDPFVLGNPVTISWTSQYATSVTIDQGIGAVALSGSITVTPVKTITYTFTASGPGGTLTHKLTFTLPAIPVVTLAAEPSKASPGDPVTLTWTSENATKLTLDPGVGSVAASGSLVVHPLVTTTYKLVAENDVGQAQATATVTVDSGKKILAFVSHPEEHSISVVDLENQRVAKSVPLSFSPAGLALSGDGMWLYIADPANNRVHRMTTQGYTIQGAYSILGTPNELAVTEDGAVLFVAGLGDGCEGSGGYCFHTVDLKTGQIVRSLSFPQAFGSLCLDPSRDSLYCLTRNGSTVWALSTADLFAGKPADQVVRRSLDLEKPVHAITLAGDASRLYAATDENVSYINLDQFYVNYWLAIQDQQGAVLPIQFATAVPNGTKLVVLLQRENYKLVMVNLETNALSLIPFDASGASSTRIHPDGVRMVIASVGSSVLSLGDTQSEALGGQVAMDAPVSEAGWIVGQILNAVSGQVRCGGVGLAGVTLSFQSAETIRTITTDAEGKYLLGLNEGTYTVKAEKTGYLFQPETTTLVVNGGVAVPDIVAATVPPTITLTANPLEVKTGEVSTLAWSSQHAESVSLSPVGGRVAPSGTLEVSPTETTLYQATASGPGGSANAEVTVKVIAPPVVTFSATASVIQAGQSTILSWTSTDATSVTIDNEVGSVPVNGSVSVTPSQTTTYTLTATGVGGTSSSSITVTVNHPVPSVTLTASPTSINVGESATLSWTSTDATSVTIDHGVGSVPNNGSVSVTPSQTTTYTLTATGAGGSASSTVTVELTIPFPVVTFTAEPSVVVPGAASKLIWTATYTTNVEIVGFGAVALNGSQEVFPTTDTIYTLRATWSGGVVTKEVEVKMLTSHLLGIFFDFRNNLKNSDIEGALAYISSESADSYRAIFNESRDKLTQFAANMPDIKPQTITDDGALFVLEETVVVDGESRVYEYEFRFIKDDDGSWKIFQF